MWPLEVEEGREDDSGEGVAVALGEDVYPTTGCSDFRDCALREAFRLSTHFGQGSHEGLMFTIIVELVGLFRFGHWLFQGCHEFLLFCVV